MAVDGAPPPMKQEQTAVVTGEAAAARIISRFAHDLLRIRDELAEVETEIDTALKSNRLAAPLMTVPGFGPRLAADFLAAVGADIAAFESPDRLASFAGLAPVPRDSGKISGNHHRPRRYDRRLLNACFQAAFIAARTCPVSRTFYERKRREGKSHKQALIALARRRINVIWAILRDRTTYDPSLPPAKAQPESSSRFDQDQGSADVDRRQKMARRPPSRPTVSIAEAREYGTDRGGPVWIAAFDQ
ncbi:hypothetical protein GCM10025867_16720 [Frondihabitans sucicola]|uniref:Transposase IS116/IS110/IS902 C-terminal domain-containing protein n=1 Tax=Frondihabitans sucicola TaxID=1268041 RepID=A0ABN6XXE3_9MICO|nr:transposase [Frondihabitans sucicola]BDZ49431.1 hypothetical protein GCM10025867_16720 [Frondihabitans sucicola]